MRMRPANTAPVIVIDLQTGMFDGIVAPPLHDADGLVSRVRAILAWARRSGRKIAFVRQNSPKGDQLERGMPGWHIWPALGQAADEPVFDKTVNNAFSNPALFDWVVGDAGADEVVLIGAATGHCVASSVEGAMALGLKVTVVSDAHSTSGRADAATVIATHNAAFAAAGVNLLTTAEMTAD